MRCKSIKASYDLAKQGLSTIRRLEAATGFFIMGYERRYGRWTRTFRAEPDNEGDKGPRLFTWKELLNDYYGGFTNISGVPISNLNNNYNCPFITPWSNYVSDAKTLPLNLVGQKFRVDAVNKKGFQTIVMLEDGTLKGLGDTVRDLFVNRTIIATGEVVGIQTHSYGSASIFYRFTFEEVI